MHTSRLVPLVVAFVAICVAVPSFATPFHGVASASACNTCHVEPVGWANPQDVWDRGCTLDCQGCHVSPTGGGLRTPMGQFYARQMLPTWGARPADTADPYQHAREGEPTEGRYSLFDGFSGWWGGDIDHTETDWLGSIDPDPVFTGGFDVRSMVVVPTTNAEARGVSAFPMELQGYLAAHPLEHLTAYVDFGLKGSRDRYETSSTEVPVTDSEGNPVLGPNGEPLTETFETGGFDAREQIWLRELFVMASGFKGNTYVRAGRFAPAYGWRVPDHTAYIRSDLGFDQNRQVYGVEVGLTPNEWWGNLGLYYQGVDAWPGEEGLPAGVGMTGQGGYRGLGYQLGVTGHALTGDVLNGDPGYREYAAGGMWAINLAPFVYLGELDVGYTDPGRAPGGGDADSIVSLVAYHEVQLVDGLPGFRPRLRYEWADRDVTLLDDHVHRIMAGAEWVPVSYLAIDTAYRTQLSPGQDAVAEFLLQLHAHW